MLKKRTTMILGAGASRPYRYPLGIELRNELLNAPSDFESALTAPDFGLNSDQWHDVQKLIRFFQRPSIDEFLAQYGEHAAAVKLAICHRLNAYEEIYQHTDPSHSDNWYLRLLDEHLANDPGLGGGLLTVATFNYDLSLEAFMFETIKVRHKLSDEKARAAVKALGVQHIYGHVGPLTSVHGEGRPYGRFQSRIQMQTAAASISTCFEDASKVAVENTQRYIAESELVAFFGFGYSDENLRRLELKAHLRSDAVVVGSNVNCPDAQQRVAPYLPDGMTMGAYSGSATAVLDAILSGGR